MAYLRESDLARVNLGQAAEVHVDGLPDKSFQGRVSFISPEAEFTPKTVEACELHVDLLALLLGSMLFLGSTLGLGLLISSYSTTQQQALLLVFFLVMPAIILSGFAFPIANMPAEVQLLTWLDPQRYYLVVVRDIFLKGAGVTDHMFEYAMMALLALAALTLSMLRLGAGELM